MHMRARDCMHKVERKGGRKSCTRKERIIGYEEEKKDRRCL